MYKSPRCSLLAAMIQLCDMHPIFQRQKRFKKTQATSFNQQLRIKKEYYKSPLICSNKVDLLLREMYKGPSCSLLPAAIQLCDMHPIIQRQKRFEKPWATSFREMYKSPSCSLLPATIQLCDMHPSSELYRCRQQATTRTFVHFS